MSHLTLSLCAYRGVLTTPSNGDGDIVTYKEVYLEKNNFTDKHLLTDGMFEVPVSSSDPISESYHLNHLCDWLEMILSFFPRLIPTLCCMKQSSELPQDDVQDVKQWEEELWMKIIKASETKCGLKPDKTWDSLKYC